MERNMSVNPFEVVWSQFIERCGDLNGILFVLVSQLEKHRELQLIRIRETGINPGLMAAGAAVGIRDLTEWPVNGWARYYPVAAYSLQGQEYIDAVDTYISLNAGWATAQAYEAFEAFIKDMQATRLHESLTPHDATSVAKFEKTVTQNGKSVVRDFQFWKTFVRWQRRTNSELLKELRKVEELDELEVRNNRNIDLRKWHEVVAEVRHAITHSRQIVRSERMKNWSGDHRKLLKLHFPGVQLSHGYELKVTREAAETQIHTIAEYGFGIFKCLSILAGFNWQVLQKDTELEGVEPA
jgi:hypothetical protein